MAYSIVTHTGDGSTTTFPINFTLGFISRDDVKCRVGSEVDGLDQPIYRALTWITDGLVQVQGAPAALGVNVEFTRTVDKDQLIHDYSDGAAITESNLDDSNKQTLMALHEFLDDRIRVLPKTDLDMNSKKITNLANGTDPQDAVTVLQAAQAIVLTPVAVQAAADAEQALADAEDAKNAAEAAASTAEALIADALLKSQNLNDVLNKETARTNLDVYSKIEAESAAHAASTYETKAVVSELAAACVKAVHVQSFSANGTYTPNANMLFAKIEAVGGGGAGGSIAGSATKSGGGGGGGGGEYSVKLVTKADVGASKAVTIGAGGAAAAAGNNTGGSGGDTSVGTLCIAKGGIGGGGSAGDTAIGGGGGIGGTGDFKTTGGRGGLPIAALITTVYSQSGSGGSTPWGQGAGSVANSPGNATVGRAGAAYGEGGSGGSVNGVATSVAGGAGAAGFVLITEYCSA